MLNLIGQPVRLPTTEDGTIIGQENLTLYVVLGDGRVTTATLAELTFKTPESLMLPGQKRWLSIEEAAARLGVSRRTLDRWLADAPAELPGAPIPGGAGNLKTSWRFDPEQLDVWARAFAAWRRAGRTRRAPGSKQSSRTGNSPSKPTPRSSILAQLRG